MNPISVVKSHASMVALLVCLGLLSGCATKSHNIYTWGSYQAQVNAYFKGTGSPEQQIAALQKSLPTSSQNISVPPGYHAHLGMLYGQLGRSDDMQIEFETEKLLFPESAPFMDFMLAKLNKNNSKKGAL